MPHQLWITALLNKYFAGAANAILGVFHLHSLAGADVSIPMEQRAALGDLQQVFESVSGMVRDQSHEIIGHGYERYVNYLTTLGLFILVCCLIGVIPGFETPTGIPSVPLGLALVTWFYYHFQGIRVNGFAYVKNFIGPEPWLVFLLFPIEIFSHLARILSLTIRLYANMFASDLVILVFFSLVPLILPLPFILLHIGVAVIQTYIFVLLATVYIGEAVAHEH